MTKIASEDGTKASPQDDPTSQMEPIATAPTPVSALTPELSPIGAVANPDSGTSALRQALRDQ
jgi:hypothetical protein